MYVSLLLSTFLLKLEKNLEEKEDLQSKTRGMKKQKKDEITLTKKTSLLVALFNKAMLKASTKRENYWGQSLNGNNVNKFLKNIDNNFSTFKES